MLRLTLLLCFGMLAALFTLGEDRGQLRPGLAMAAAEGRLDEVRALARAKGAQTPQQVAEPAATVAEFAPEPVPDPVAEAPAPVAMASSGPVVEVEAGRNIARAADEPVFTLSALGDASVAGEDAALIKISGDEATPEAEPTVAGGTIWYVTANSVNVRAAPSTEAEVLGRLGSGEATLLVAAVDSDWARIVIQGDGVEGYVALRYLSPDTP